MADSHSRMIRVPDPVHGYIPVEARFMDIVDTPEFQRLRSIEQGSFRPVFPGARHDRFLHSLGTYHLATIFAEHFFRNLKEDTGIRVDPAEEKMLRLTFRYAALLHDVGHAPFSHTTEDLFMDEKDARDIPVIWNALCRELEQVAPDSAPRFEKSTAEKQGAAHEIMSARILLQHHSRFTGGARWKAPLPDPELAVRMIIGYTYSDADTDHAARDPDTIRKLGIRNCLIQLLNCSVLDVDRLDYLVRDTRMSGFVNAPLDLDTLARSVTAVEENGWLRPAFRSIAISAFETMYHAKLSHDAWVLAHPAGAYDAALRQHCIRSLDPSGCKPEDSYIRNVFCADALGAQGVTFRGKTYRLLSDTDVAADLKAMSGAPFDELLTRAPGQRRTAVWNSYYEFRYLFTRPASGLTHTKVYDFFLPLIGYLERKHLFEFNPAVFQTMIDTPAGEIDEKTRKAAVFLDAYLRKIRKNEDSEYSVVLMSRDLSFSVKLNLDELRIVFTKKSFPHRENVPTGPPSGSCAIWAASPGKGRRTTTTTAISICSAGAVWAASSCRSCATIWQRL